MRAFQRFLAILLLLPSLASNAQEVKDDRPELVVLNWNEYMDPSVIQTFEQRFKVRVREVYFGSDDEAIELMIAGGGKGFDVILVPGSLLASYVRRDWLMKLDPSLLPNLANVESRWSHGFDKAAEYGSPYLWGTMGVVYRKDLVGSPPTKWRDIFEPRPEWEGHILMPEDAQKLIGLGLKSLGYSLNEESKEAFAKVEALLEAQKPAVAGYAYADLSAESRLVTGDIWLSTTYNGDALLLMDNSGSDQLAFVVPEEGTALWCDYFTISAKTEQAKLAHAFLNFLQLPEIAQRNAETSFFATTNEKAEPLLSPEFRANLAIYPPPKVIEKSEFVAQKNPRTLKRWNSLFARLVN